MTPREVRAARVAARTLDPDRLARLAEREARAHARLLALLGDRPHVDVPGYRVLPDGPTRVRVVPRDGLPDGWAQLEAWTP